ncbi:MAG: metal-dependent hydrolase [Spirochaetia bacterium]|nr:metal-dependent hydrolase [Spirochaetia bacterium]
MKKNNYPNSLPSEKIIFRKMNFKLSLSRIENWHSENVFLSHFFNAMSIMFPEGEKFFIERVHYYKSKIQNPELLNCVKLFYKQEGRHTAEHLKYNHLLAESGHDLKRLEQYTINGVEIYHKKHPLTQLALVVAFEHFTAILAEVLLKNHQSLLKSTDREFSRLWMWHAAEELEHKSVAFDVYLEVGGGYFRRCYAMHLAAFRFFLNLTKSLFYLLKKDIKKMNFKILTFGILYLFFYPGLLSRMIPGYFLFFIPGFHPWKNKNHDLINEVLFKMDPLS